MILFTRAKCNENIISLHNKNKIFSSLFGSREHLAIWKNTGQATWAFKEYYHKFLLFLGCCFIYKNTGLENPKNSVKVYGTALNIFLIPLEQNSNFCLNIERRLRRDCLTPAQFCRKTATRAILATAVSLPSHSVDVNDKCIVMQTYWQPVLQIGLHAGCRHHEPCRLHDNVHCNGVGWEMWGNENF